VLSMEGAEARGSRPNSIKGLVAMLEQCGPSGGQALSLDRG
jgi:hypothetical protein